MNYFFTFINVVALALLGYIIYQQIEEHKYYDKDNVIIEEVVATEIPAPPQKEIRESIKENTQEKEIVATTDDSKPAVSSTATIEDPEIPAVESTDDDEVVEKITEDEE